MPALHWPMQLATSPPGHSVPHAPPTSVRLSSIEPSQSLSMPSQTSDEGPTFPEHCRVPFEHTYVPALHCPTQFATSPPGHSVPHAPPTSVGLLSIVLSQSSSRPLHVSAT